MSATSEVLKSWFAEGVQRGATHMIVVCDTFDHSDYPVYVEPGQDAREEAKKYEGENMQKLMEVYDLRLPATPQLSRGLVFNY